MGSRVRVDHDGDLAYVTLTRSDKHNAMDLAMLREMLAIQKQLRKQRNLRAVILQGDGPSFCSGMDFKSLMASPLSVAGSYLQLWWPFRNQFQRWSVGWRDLSVPVIALIHGNCFGAGLQLALGADIRVCRPDAQLSLMEARWGLVPDMGGIALLRELVSLDTAKELTFTGRIIAGEQAQQLGLVTHVQQDPLAHALTLIDECLVRSPDAVAAGKQLLQAAWRESDDEALKAERQWQRRIIGRRNQRIALERNNKKNEQPYETRSIS